MSGYEPLAELRSQHARIEWILEQMRADSERLRADKERHRAEMITILNAQTKWIIGVIIAVAGGLFVLVCLTPPPN